MTAKQALAEIVNILEAVDHRCAAADGPVTPTRHEMTDKELRQIYVLAIRQTKHRHYWNDGVVFKGALAKHAVAKCDQCGLVAFERGHSPKKPVYVEDES